MSSSGAATTAAIAAELGLSLTSERVETLDAFVGLLLRWNATFNLTAIREPGEIRLQHLADCLAVLPALDRERTGGRLLDVGSGGGLPGAVIAIARPALDVTCIDAVGKKAAFVRQVAATLGLGNLHAVHGRVEGYREGVFDVVVSRAFSSLADFVRLTRSVLAPGGVWMAMKGRRPLDEMAALPGDVEVFHVEPLTVPRLGAERCLVWIRPRAGA